MEFIRCQSERSEELSAYLYPIWHEVFDTMMPGGFDDAEYIFQKWTCPQAIAESIDEHGYEYGYIVEDGVRIGLYSFHIQDDGRFYINKLYLEKEHRGKGLAQKAISLMEKLARENGCSGMFLNVYYYNEKAIKAYFRAGFEKHYRCLGWLGNGLTRNDYIMRKIF